MIAKRVTKRAASAPTKQAGAKRESNTLETTRDFAALVERVVTIIDEARSRVLRTVNSEMVLSNWHVGREIVEYVQRGEARAEYGETVIEDLSRQLQARVGRGYSTTNLRYFRTFYTAYRDRRPEIRHIGGAESGNDAGVAAGGRIRHRRSGVPDVGRDPPPPVASARRPAGAGGAGSAGSDPSGPAR